MLLALLLVAQAAAEWVEISQQHYRKPIRPHSSFNPFTTPDKFEVEDTTKAWTYNNRSVTEYNWNKPSIKQPIYSGTIRRVEYATSSVKTTEVFRVEDEYSDSDKDEFELRTREPTKPVPEVNDNNKQKATITRVPNIGNIRRVQVSNAPVKSTFLNKDDKEKVAKTRYEELPLENEQVEELFEHKRRTEGKTNNRRIYVSQLKKQQNTEPTSTFPVEDESPFTEENITKRPKQELKNTSNTKNTFSSNPTFVTETEDFTPTEKSFDKFYKVTKATIPRVTEKKHIFTTETTEIDVDRTTEEKPKQTTKLIHKISDSVKHRPVNKFSSAELDGDSEEIINNEQRKASKKSSNTEMERERRPEKEMTANKKEVREKEKKDLSKGNKPDSKLNNMENLMKLMKVVTDTISQNTRRSVGGKMRYLHDLKDTILANIGKVSFVFTTFYLVSTVPVSVIKSCTENLSVSQLS